MTRIVRFSLLVLVALTSGCFASADQLDTALAKATKLSSLTEHGAQPFHLKLTVSDPANPQSSYSATIEEYWKSSKDWYRAILSPDFQQFVVVRDGQRIEQNIGGYYPLWLRNFATAAAEPLEDSSFWGKNDAKFAFASSLDGHPSSTCARAQLKVGGSTLNNDSIALICFNADGTLSSIVRPGYDMEFRDARAFGKKRIAFEYVSDTDPGTELVGKVEILDKIDPADNIPDLPQPTAQTSGQIRSVAIGQEEFYKLLDSPLRIAWPHLHSGNLTGKLSVYVSADREGKIREVYPLDSDNPDLQGALRDQLLKVPLEPEVIDEKPVQIETALTFHFSTTLDSSPEPSVQASDPQADKSQSK